MVMMMEKKGGRMGAVLRCVTVPFPRSGRSALGRLDAVSVLRGNGVVLGADWQYLAFMLATTRIPNSFLHRCWTLTPLVQG